jgi:hypothetical protein
MSSTRSMYPLKKKNEKINDTPLLKVYLKKFECALFRPRTGINLSKKFEILSRSPVLLTKIITSQLKKAKKGI